jgi:hypothetical protein
MPSTDTNRPTRRTVAQGNPIQCPWIVNIYVSWADRIIDGYGADHGMGPLVENTALPGAVESTLHTAARHRSAIMGQTVRQTVPGGRRKEP